MRKTLWIFGALFSVGSIADAAVIEPDQIRQAFGFSGEMQLTDKTQEVVAKSGSNILAALVFQPDDGGFSKIQVVVTKGGFLTNDPRHIKLRESAAFRKIELSNGATGFVGVEGAGPGGEGYVAFAHLPKPDLDVQLKVIISNDGATPDSPKVESFHEALRDEAKLQAILGGLLGNLDESLIRENPFSSDNRHLGKLDSPKESPSGTLTKKNEGSKAERSETKRGEDRSIWIWLATAFVVLAAMGWACIHLVNKRK